ncbi:MAG: hypothetical protein DRQ39_09540 [Gammaproteobacteria bacterium]|nr:MAG: hypothetical protein DRQ39_09540 [Gammaproteobacteria bacterium]
MVSKLKNLSEAKKYLEGYKKPFKVLYVCADGGIYDSKDIAERYSKHNNVELFTVKKKKDGGSK